MTAAEVNGLIDVLDRAERADASVWRRPLAILWETLHKAQRVRRWLATPLLAMSIAAPEVWREDHWATWLVTSSILAVTAFWLMQRVLEGVYPVLDRETGVETFWSYFQSGGDYDEGASA